MALIDDIRSQFPWLDQMGISLSWLQNVVATAASTAEVVQQIRNTPQYKQRFPGMYRQDGTVRMTEAQYMQQETAYRSLLRQYGYDVDREFSNPQSLVGFFQGEIAPDELSDRLVVYRQVQQGGQRLKDAFYVYAGMSLSDDDLYEAIVDPAAAQRLSSEYNAKVASNPLDYQTFIARSTALGLQRVTDTLNDLQRRGAVTGEAVQRLISVDPTFAQEVVSALYASDDPVNKGGTLSLQELLDAFEFAAVGSAAQAAGLEMPSRERLAEIRAAGVDRSKAIASYQEFGRSSAQINAAVQRARGKTFGREQFEAAEFLGEATAMTDLRKGLGAMAAAGKSGGSFRFDEEDGRFVQRGFTAA